MKEKDSTKICASKTIHRRKRKKTRLSISEIISLAREEKLSYGEYVAKYNV